MNDEEYKAWLALGWKERTKYFITRWKSRMVKEIDYKWHYLLGSEPVFPNPELSRHYNKVPFEQDTGIILLCWATADFDFGGEEDDTLRLLEYEAVPFEHITDPEYCDGFFSFDRWMTWGPDYDLEGKEIPNYAKRLVAWRYVEPLTADGIDITPYFNRLEGRGNGEEGIS